jgi:CcmD family protein
MKSYIVSTFLLFFAISSPLAAQDLIEVSIHSSGKIYLVVATLVAIFIGIVVYLLSIDKHLSKIEKQIKDNG